MISRSKAGARSCRASEKRFRTFVDHATDAFFLHDDQIVVVDVNRQACQSLGYMWDELVGMTPLDFDPDVTPAMLRSTGGSSTQGRQSHSNPATDGRTERCSRSRSGAEPVPGGRTADFRSALARDMTEPEESRGSAAPERGALPRHVRERGRRHHPHVIMRAAGYKLNQGSAISSATPPRSCSEEPSGADVPRRRGGNLELFGD